MEQTMTNINPWKKSHDRNSNQNYIKEKEKKCFHLMTNEDCISNQDMKRTWVTL